jgi:hypothetical protein
MRRLLMLISLIGISQSAQAHWDLEFGVTTAQLQTNEFSSDGYTIVRERGVVPGLVFSLGRRADAWRYYFYAEALDGNLSYHGQTQAGIAQSSVTSTRSHRFSFGAQVTLTPSLEVFSALERDYWGRDIQASGSALGLSETYRSWRLLAGFGIALYESTSFKLNGKLTAVASSSQDIHVRFDQSVFDATNLRSKPAIGARVALEMTNQSFPNWSLAPEFDWLRVRAGDPVGLMQNGRVVGSVAQPEHSRMQFSAKLLYRF